MNERKTENEERKTGNLKNRRLTMYPFVSCAMCMGCPIEFMASGGDAPWGGLIRCWAFMWCWGLMCWYCAMWLGLMCCWGLRCGGLRRGAALRCDDTCSGEN